jgi:hypothetical protein
MGRDRLDTVKRFAVANFAVTPRPPSLSMALTGENPSCVGTGSMSALGQKAKYSRRADVFRFTPKTGHRSMQSACPKSATNGLMRCNVQDRYSITSSASDSNVGLLACSIGRSPGLVPARISRHRCPHGESRPRGRWIGHQQAGASPFRVYADHRLCRPGITLDMPRIGRERMIAVCRIGRKTGAYLCNDQAH